MTSFIFSAVVCASFVFAKNGSCGAVPFFFQVELATNTGEIPLRPF